MESASYNWPTFKFSDLKVLQSESFILLLFLTLFPATLNSPLGLLCRLYSLHHADFALLFGVCSGDSID